FDAVLARQIDMHFRTLADARLDRHRAADLLRQPINLRQPKPGAFAGLLGREEWLENVAEDVLADPGAAVDHRYPDEIAAAEIARPTRRDGGHVGCLDAQRPARRHRIAGVQSEVQHAKNE